VADRPTKKERRQLAKQAHAQASRRARRRRLRARIFRAVSLVLVVAGIVWFFQWQSKKNREQQELVSSLAAELGCEYQHIPSGYSGRDGNAAPHQNEGPITYARLPPEAGAHRDAPVTDTGVYTEPLPVEHTTHNLEHGHVVLHYAETVSDPVVEQLNDAALATPGWVLVTPYANFSNEQVLSMTAWEHRLDCPKTRADQAEQFGELARAFIGAYRDQSYESLPGRDTIDQRTEDESDEE